MIQCLEPHPRLHSLDHCHVGKREYDRRPLAECLRLFVLALNPLYASSHANTSSNQQLGDTGVFV